ncbi:MAG TPA: vitamin K epoxide reductase family protein [Ktedonobacteraceae bacterium]|nr:vitamin K epoxide reductase family protein [Ktedonobacteraceae bacterium]
MDKNRPVAQLVLLLLSVAGIGIAIYLTAVHYEHVPLVCSTHGFVDCSLVLSSPYSVIPGTSVPITVPGLFWGLVSAALAIIALRLSPPFSPALRNIHIAQFTWSLVGMLTVLYLVYVEIVKLHTICAWCTAMHAIILVMFLITLVQIQQRPDCEEESETETELESERV